MVNGLIVLKCNSSKKISKRTEFYKNKMYI